MENNTNIMRREFVKVFLKTIYKMEELEIEIYKRIQFPECQNRYRFYDSEREGKEVPSKPLKN
jgi:hypothetical protein